MNVLQTLKCFYQDYTKRKGIIGYSYLGSPIYYFEVFKTSHPTIIFTYGIHAREYITTYLAMEQIKHFERFGFYGRVFFIPAVNPDGINISLTRCPSYKANARGVDLNVNFDALWGSGSQNVFFNGKENYVGKCPFSEIESKSLACFTLDVNPDMTVSYHSKGEEIYWDFYQDKPRFWRDYQLAKVVKNITGYKIKSGLASAGGYKDWCVKRLKIPALTIEVGSDALTHPIDQTHLKPIFRKNQWVVNAITEQLYEKQIRKNCNTTSL